MALMFFIIMFVLMMNVLWRYIDELVGKERIPVPSSTTALLRHDQHDPDGSAARHAAGGHYDHG